MIEVTGDGDASRYLYSRGLIVFSRRLTARQRHKSTSAPIYWTLVLHCMVNAHPTGRTLFNDLRLAIDHFDSVNKGDRWSGDPAGKSAKPGQSSTKNALLSRMFDDCIQCLLFSSLIMGVVIYVGGGGGDGGAQHSQRNGQLTEMTRMNSKVQEIAHKRALLFNKVDKGHCLKGNCPSCDKTSLLSQCGQTGGQLAGKSRLWEQRNADFKTAPAPSGRTLMTLTCDVALAKAYLCIPAVIRKKI
ncbi:hypothetical protein T09_6020 [Trichinella sp. T9]|nr:hypothetical protein T09_6020 [Trichinella sp. T9]